MNNLWTTEQLQQRETCMRDLFVTLAHHLRTVPQDSIEDVLLAERINAIVDRHEPQVLLSTGCDLLKAVAAELVTKGVTAIPAFDYQYCPTFGIWDVHRATLLAQSALMVRHSVQREDRFAAESKTSHVLARTLSVLDESDRDRAMTLFDAVAYSATVLLEVVEPGTPDPTPADAIQRFFDLLARSEYVAIQPPRIDV